nr:unnamed protein product [Callosobruchus analis]
MELILKGSRLRGGPPKIGSVVATFPLRTLQIHSATI